VEAVACAGASVCAAARHVRRSPAAASAGAGAAAAPGPTATQTGLCSIQVNSISCSRFLTCDGMGCGGLQGAARPSVTGSLHLDWSIEPQTEEHARPHRHYSPPPPPPQVPPLPLPVLSSRCSLLAARCSLLAARCSLASLRQSDEKWCDGWMDGSIQSLMCVVCLCVASISLSICVFAVGRAVRCGAAYIRTLHSACRNWRARGWTRLRPVRRRPSPTASTTASRASALRPARKQPNACTQNKTYVRACARARVRACARALQPAVAGAVGCRALRWCGAGVWWVAGRFGVARAFG
jgi:hypothetical protein